MKRTVIITTIIRMLAAGNTYAQVPKTGIYEAAATIAIVNDEATKTITGSFETCIQEGKICCTFNFKTH